MTTNRHSGIRERIAPVDPYRLGCFGGPVDFIFATLLFLLRWLDVDLQILEELEAGCSPA